MSTARSLPPAESDDFPYGLPASLYDGRLYDGHPWPAGRRVVEGVRNFPLDDSDLIISGFMKSGTNWLQVMLANLWDDWGTCAITVNRRVPNLGGTSGPHYMGYQHCIAAEAPRLMKVHLWIDMMPTRWPEHGKVIHITRNPKDVCVSLYHEFRRSFGLSEDWPAFVDRFVRGKVIYGPYLDNVLGWHAFDHPNLLKITYEEMRRDVRSVLGRIVAFAGKETPPPARLEEIVAKTEFEHMRTSELRSQINILDPNQHEEFLRKAVIGEWKNAMTAEQSGLIDREIVRPLEEHGVFLTYE